MKAQTVREAMNLNDRLCTDYRPRPCPLWLFYLLTRGQYRPVEKFDMDAWEKHQKGREKLEH